MLMHEQFPEPDMSAIEAANLPVLSRPGLSYSLESIEYQDGAFFNDLNDFFIDCRAAKIVTRRELMEVIDEYANRLTAIIKLHTNLNIRIEFDTNDGPGVLIPDVTNNHILLENWIRGFFDNAEGRKIIKDAGGFAVGSVNRKTSKVTGFFTKLNPTMFMPSSCIFGNALGWSTEELAAITLHEVGHTFTYCEYMAYSARVSVVMAGLSRALDGSLPAEEIEVVLTDAKHALNLKSLDEKTTARITDKRAVQVVVMAAYFKDCRDELGYDLYNENIWEMLADDFSVRHGGRRFLITALDKFYRGGSDTASPARFYFIEALRVLAVIGAIVAAIISPMIIMHAIGIVLMALAAGPTMGGTTYDRPMLRFKRIRNDILLELRKKDIDKRRAIVLRDEIKFVDERIKDFNDNVPFFSALGGLLVRSWGKRIEGERVTKELEGLIANRLWVVGAELKYGI